MLDKSKLFLQAYEGQVQIIKIAVRNDSSLVKAVDEVTVLVLIHNLLNSILFFSEFYMIFENNIVFHILLM